MEYFYNKPILSYDPEFFIKKRRYRLYGPPKTYLPPILPDGRRQWLVKARPHPNLPYEDKYVYAHTPAEAKQKLQKMFPWHRCIGKIEPSDLDTSDHTKYVVIA